MYECSIATNKIIFMTIQIFYALELIFRVFILSHLIACFDAFNKCGVMQEYVPMDMYAQSHFAVLLTHCRLNELPYTIYWMILISILGSQDI